MFERNEDGEEIQDSGTFTTSHGGISVMICGGVVCRENPGEGEYSLEYGRLIERVASATNTPQFRIAQAFRMYEEYLAVTLDP